METSFSDAEKRFVLGEMIKVSTVEIGTLVDFIKAHSLEPNWMSMQLPGGRNMNQCYGAVESMFQAKVTPPNLNSFKRKSMSDLVDHPAKRQATMAPSEQPAMPPVRVIQPRPPSNGYQPPPTPQAGPAVTITGKKRGRPSKADKEAQARANSTRPMPPITPAPLAPMTLQPPQRDFASSPGYEVSAGPLEQIHRGFARPLPHDSIPQTGSSYLASPASGTGTPRALPEPLEHGDGPNLSPRDRNIRHLDTKSPPLLPRLLQKEAPLMPSPTPQRPQPVKPQPQQDPIQPPPIRPQPYEPYRPDPIFPHRDRSRNPPGPMAQELPPVPTATQD